MVNGSWGMWRVWGPGFSQFGRPPCVTQVGHIVMRRFVLADRAWNTSTERVVQV